MKHIFIEQMQTATELLDFRSIKGTLVGPPQGLHFYWGERSTFFINCVFVTLMQNEFQACVASFHAAFSQRFMLQYLLPPLQNCSVILLSYHLLSREHESLNPPQLT